MSTMTQTNSNRKLVLSDILEQRAYERIRDTRRAEIIELKRRRRISLGTIVTVMFENRATMQSQIQEMLRVERVVSDEGVLEELKAYNPLIPEAGQLCATVFIELVTDEQMREWLPKLVDIEKSIAIKLANGEVVKATVDEAHAEQLTRETVTAAVHYIRFQFTPQQVVEFAKGDVQVISTLSNYLEAVELADFTVAELLTDLRD
jgi:predicted XRE-type DNA-binding protein